MKSRVRDSLVEKRLGLDSCHPEGVLIELATVWDLTFRWGVISCAQCHQVPLSTTTAAGIATPIGMREVRFGHLKSKNQRSCTVRRGPTLRKVCGRTRRFATPASPAPSEKGPQIPQP